MDKPIMITKEGYNLIGGVCIKKSDSWCKSYNSNGKCSECFGGAYLENSKCIECNGCLKTFPHKCVMNKNK